MLKYLCEVLIVVFFSFFCQMVYSGAETGDGKAGNQSMKKTKDIIKENELVAMSISLENENNNVPLERTVDKATFKLLRGVTNLATAGGEVPRQLILSAMNDNVFLVLPVGLSRGVALTVVRTLTGLVETLFFYYSPDGSYDSFLNPDFVWQPEQRNPRKQYPPLN